jgi:hypothetical protein
MQIFVILSKADFIMQEIRMLLSAMERISTNKYDDNDDDNDDDDLEDKHSIIAELKELKVANAQRQMRLDDYKKLKKWNVDNMCLLILV